MKNGFQLMILCVMMLGCARGAVKKELLSLMDNPGTAAGSDLMTALCGWPAGDKLRPDSMDIELGPESTGSSGQGFVRISAGGDSFSCTGKVSFSYWHSYGGGHGYSGGNEIQLGKFKRLDAVDAAISDPPGARPIGMNETRKGQLGEKSGRLPDGSFADHYSINLENENPLLRFNLEAEKGLNPRGYVYQGGKLVDVFSSRWSGTAPYDNICFLEKGRAVVLITTGKKSGSYAIRLDEPDEAARSMLKMPERYRKKAR